MRTHLVRDRVFTFTPCFPFAFVPKIPEKIRQGAGGAEGGFQGGIPPRPPRSAITSPFFADSATFTFLRQFLLEVRTYFAEYPQG